MAIRSTATTHAHLAPCSWLPNDAGIAHPTSSSKEVGMTGITPTSRPPDHEPRGNRDGGRSSSSTTGHHHIHHLNPLATSGAGRSRGAPRLCRSHRPLAAQALSCTEGATCVLPNAFGVCSSGNCMLRTCNPGFANCNGSAADGCETELRFDDDNCGRCGNVCGGLTECRSGTCQTVN